jgi:hypothetical protein
MNVYLVAVRRQDGAKELYRIAGAPSFAAAAWAAHDSGFRTVLVLMQPIATGVKETA